MTRLEPRDLDYKAGNIPVPIIFSFNLRKVTVLIFSRGNAPDMVRPYRHRTVEAYQLLCDLRTKHHLKIWKLRGFTESSYPILYDGVYLN